MRDIKSLRSRLQGKATFVHEFEGQAKLFCRFLRSTKARAKIIAIEIPEPPEGIIVYSAKDLASNSLEVFGDNYPILAEREVGFFGQPILLVAGESNEKVSNFLTQIKVHYEDISPRFQFFETTSGEVYKSLSYGRGNCTEAFEQAYQKFDSTFSTGSQAHMYGESHGAFTELEDSTFTIHAHTQWPFHISASVSNALGIPEKDISVVACHEEISMDGKIWSPSLYAVMTALVTKETGKSAFFLESSEDDFRFLPKRFPSRHTIRTAIDKSGDITAVEYELILPGGAFPVFTEEILRRASKTVHSFYNCRNVEFKGTILRTNHPPFGAFNGLSATQVFFALQSSVREIYETVQDEVTKWNQANCFGWRRSGQTKASSPNYPATLEHAKSLSDFSRKYSAFELLKKRRQMETPRPYTLRGIGIASAFQIPDFVSDIPNSRYAVRLRLDEDRKATLFSSAIPGGPHLHAVWRNIIREALGIEDDSIHMEFSDSSIIPDSGPNIFGRNIGTITKLIMSCCNSIQKKRFRSPLPIEITRSTRLSRKDSSGGPVPLKDHSRLSSATATVELALDPQLAEIEIRGIWISIDGGLILDKDYAKRTVEADIFRSLSWTTSEYCRYIDGILPEDLYQNYSFLHPSEVPFPVIDFVASSGKEQPKPIDQLASNTIPAAFINALCQATGQKLSYLPVTRESLFSIMESE